MMQKKYDGEFTHPSEEFTVPGDEFTAPKQEYFLRAGERNTDTKRQRYWLRKAISVILCFVILISAGYRIHTKKMMIPDLPAVPTETVPPIELTEATEATEDLESTAPPSESTMTAEPTEAQNPKEIPDMYHISFIACSSEIHGCIYFSGMNKIQSCVIEVYDVIQEEPLETIELTREEINNEYYLLDGLDTTKYYMQYMDLYEKTGTWPDPEFRIIMTYDDGNGSETKEQLVRPTEVQGWSARFLREDSYFPDFLEPGMFVITTYESLEAPTILLGSKIPPKAGEMSLRIFIFGIEIDPSEMHVQTVEEPGYMPDENGNMVPSGDIFYYTYIYYEVPEWMKDCSAQVIMEYGMPGEEGIFFLSKEVSP